ncbi:MAG: extracellular solute-binding protein [Synergistetes bacterium]|nr:extracellular solute-binding protein [Synergistota bacterium]
MRKGLVVMLVALVALATFSLPTYATPTKLTFWNMPFTTGEVLSDYVKWWQKEVKKALPDVEVSKYYGPGQYDAIMKSFVVQARTGKPDVVEGLTEQLAVYVKMGLIADLTKYFNSWKEKDKFLPNAIAACTVNGKLYGIPYNINVRGMLYRKDIFKKYHLSVPKTWKELIKTAALITRLTNGKIHGFDFCSAVNEPRAFQEFISWFDQINNKKQMFVYKGGKWKLNAKVSQFEKIFKLYYDLTFYKAPYSAFDPNNRGGAWQQEDLGYVAGKYAMVPMGPWIWGHRNDNKVAKAILEEKTGVTSLPIPEGGVKAAYLEVKPIMLNKYSKHPAKAWELIKFITSKTAMGKWDAAEGVLPPRKDTLAMPEFQNWWAKAWGERLPEGVGLAPINWAPVEYAILTALNTVIYKVNTPHEAAVWLHNKLSGMADKGILGK